MRRYWLRASCLAVPVALLLASAATAQNVKNFTGGNPSKDDLIHALTPPAGNPEVKYRGLKIMNEAPAEQKSAMPAVALRVNFELNSAELTPDARDVLKQVAAAMQSSSLQRFHFLLEGHTDNTGSADYNLSLSRRRAKAVFEFLTVSEKVPADRLVIEGKGASAPLDPAHPEDAANRRVQIVNVGS